MKDTMTLPVVLGADVIAALPAVPFGVDGVTDTALWQGPVARAGILRIGAGRRLGAHAHRHHHHHLWLVEGGATVLGSALGPGSYVHVPVGIDHDIDATATDGCTVVYVYERSDRPT